MPAFAGMTTEGLRHDSRETMFEAIEKIFIDPIKPGLRLFVHLTAPVDKLHFSASSHR